MPTNKTQNTRIRPLSRSQSSVEFLVSGYDQDDQRSSVLARPSSSDSMVSLSSGLTIDFSTDVRLTTYKGSSADSPTSAAPSKKSKDSEYISMKTDRSVDSVKSWDKISPGVTNLSVKNNDVKSSNVETRQNGWIGDSTGTNHVPQVEKKTNKSSTVST